EAPERYGRLVAQVVDRAGRGELAPLPRHVFSRQQASEAFGLMTRAEHIGKVVLTFEPPGGRVTVVQSGAAMRQAGPGRFTIRPSEPSDYSALFDALEEGGARVQHIVDVRGAAPAASGEGRGDRQLTQSFFGPLALAQEIGRRELSQPL